MADAFTQVSSVSTVQAAYNMLAFFALREQLYYDACADVKATRQDKQGSTVVFTIYDDLAVATSALTETVDPDAVALSDNQVTVTLAEYGNAVNHANAYRRNGIPQRNRLDSPGLKQTR